MKKPKFLRIVVEVPEGGPFAIWNVASVRMFDPFCWQQAMARIVSVTAVREPKRKPAKRGRSKK